MARFNPTHQLTPSGGGAAASSGRTWELTSSTDSVQAYSSQSGEYMVHQHVDGVVDASSASVPFKFAPIEAASANTNAVVSAVAGKKIRVLNYTMIAQAPVRARWKSDATALSGNLSLDTHGGASPAGTIHSPVFDTGSGLTLSLYLASAVSVDGHLCYVEV